MILTNIRETNTDQSPEGGKDKDQECHGSGYMEYDDGSHLSGSWKHGRREGHFRLDTSHPLSSVYHLQGDYKVGTFIYI